jgi:oligogalacturonide transport system permease protein
MVAPILLSIMKLRLKEVLSKLKIKTGYHNYIGLAYISPWIIGFLAFQLYPLVASFIYSFTDFALLKAPKFVGMQNYITMFTNDRNYLISLQVTIWYVIMSLPLKLAFALFIALLLNMKLKGIGSFRTIYYLPSILGGSVAISVLWRFIFMKEGLLNTILGIFGFHAFDWLGDPHTSLGVLSLLQVWQFGSSMVLFLAGLKQIPDTLYEAGRIDGATWFKQFTKITIPMLSPIILFNMVMQMIQLFQDFTSAFVVTPNGGPLRSTYLYGLMLYQNGFEFFKMGYASAQSWILFAIIILITVILFKLSDNWVYYEDGGR